MMGTRQRLIDGDEYDFIYARGQYCYLVNRCKKKRKIKRKINKRLRRENKKYIYDIE